MRERICAPAEAVDALRRLETSDTRQEEFGLVVVFADTTANVPTEQSDPVEHPIEHSVGYACLTLYRACYPKEPFPSAVETCQLRPRLTVCRWLQP